MLEFQYLGRFIEKGHRGMTLGLGLVSCKVLAMMLLLKGGKFLAQMGGLIYL